MRKNRLDFSFLLFIISLSLAFTSSAYASENENTQNINPIINIKYLNIKYLPAKEVSQADFRELLQALLTNPYYNINIKNINIKKTENRLRPIAPGKPENKRPSLVDPYSLSKKKKLGLSPYIGALQTRTEVEPVRTEVEQSNQEVPRESETPLDVFRRRFSLTAEEYPGADERFRRNLHYSNPDNPRRAVIFHPRTESRGRMAFALNSHLRDRLLRLSDRFSVSLFFVDRPQDIENQLAQFADGSLDFLVLGGHGPRSGTFLDLGQECLSVETRLSSHYTRVLSPEGLVFLRTCYGGVGPLLNHIARSVSGHLVTGVNISYWAGRFQLHPKDPREYAVDGSQEHMCYAFVERPSATTVEERPSATTVEERPPATVACWITNNIETIFPSNHKTIINYKFYLSDYPNNLKNNSQSSSPSVGLREKINFMSPYFFKNNKIFSKKKSTSQS